MKNCKACGSPNVREVNRDGNLISVKREGESLSPFFKCNDCGSTTHYKFRHFKKSPITQRGIRLVANAA